MSKKEALANSMRRRPSLKKTVTANEETAKKVVAKVADKQPKPAAKAKKPATTKTTKTVGIKAGPVKRLTIDLPASLHKKLKMATIESGESMRDHVVRLIEKSVK